MYLRLHNDLNINRGIGGTAIKDDVERLRAGQHMVVGTPGRVFDMVNKSLGSIMQSCVYFPRLTLEAWASRNNLRVDDLKVFVLDEAVQTACLGRKNFLAPSNYQPTCPGRRVNVTRFQGANMTMYNGRSIKALLVSLVLSLFSRPHVSSRTRSTTFSNACHQMSR